MRLRYRTCGDYRSPPRVAAMHLEWIIVGRGGDTVEVDSAEDAHAALCDAVRASYKGLGPGAMAERLSPVYALRLAMVTDGRTAVERGDEWLAQVGGILVRLSP